MSRVNMVFDKKKRTYVLVLLSAISLFNYADRQIFAILLQPIKREFGASDTQMGLLTGAAFAIVYVLAGVPLARRGDLGVRRDLIAICIGVWSVLTFACGMAQSYGQLVLTRMGVAVGEAGSLPASYSMISDLYPVEKRTGAISTLYFAGSVGIGLSLFVGGYLGEVIGWRKTLICFAVPGMLIALLLRFTTREPVRMAVHDDNPPRLSAAVKDLWRYPSFRCLSIYALSTSFTGYSILGWAPTFFIRIHGMPPSTVGFWMGMGMFASSFGALFAGKLADQVVRHDLRWLFRIAATVTALVIPLGAVMLTASSQLTALICFFMYAIVFAASSPIYFSLAVSLAAPRTRGLASAILSILQNIGGVGLGPFIVGILSDHFRSATGAESIRYSLLVSLTGVAIATITAAVGVKFIRDDYNRSTRV